MRRQRSTCGLHVAVATPPIRLMRCVLSNSFSPPYIMVLLSNPTGHKSMPYWAYEDAHPEHQKLILEQQRKESCHAKMSDEELIQMFEDEGFIFDDIGLQA
ncbi:hypothetical protein [Gimesia algae]|uniref:hypothetical protein n=1 Tax=Gimesia algae TaxID=2527971 RepID=UPI0011A8E4C0|nr:hypothetical protein [Gimesia algae]